MRRRSAMLVSGLAALWALVPWSSGHAAAEEGSEARFRRLFQRETVEQRAARLGVDPAILLPTPIDSTEEPPQVWTRYEFNSSSVYNSFEIYFTWHEAVGPNLFQAFQFFFEAEHQGGYIGPQVVNSTKKMIFSIWDLRDRPQTAVPLGPDCGRFNGAGENGGGAQCVITHNWIPGRKYRLQVARYGVGADLSAYWKGVVRDTVTGEETTIGQIGLRSASSGRVGYGWLASDPATFLEYFADQTHCTGQLRSSLTWQGPYANGDETITPYKAEPSYTSCPRSDASSTGKPFITHEGGDGSVRSFEAGVNAWRYSTRQAYLLFSYPDHRAELQHFDTNTEQRTVAKTFYPPAGEYRAFQYQKLPDGSAKLLWADPIAGSAAVWTLNSNNDVVSTRQFPSIQPSVWKAVAYHKLPLGARLLWSNQSGSTGQIAIWKLDENDNVVSQVTHSLLPPAWRTTAYTLDEGVPAVVWVNTTNPLRCEAMLGWFDLEGNYLGSIALPSGSGACRDGDSVGYQSRGLRHLFYFSEVSFLSLLRPDYTRQSTLLHQALSDPALVHFSYVSAIAAASEPPPGLSIGDASVQEGDQGATMMEFRVTLSRPINRPVTVLYETVDGSAVAAAGDYAPTAGVLTFPPGTTEQTTAVAALGDLVDEGAGEAFHVRLRGSIFPVLLLDGKAAGSIVDDDPPPRISTQDNSIVEGSSGTRPLNYHLHLDRRSAFEVRVTLRTEDVTARAGADYLARNEPLVFAPGQTDRDVPIFVIGDRLHEPGPNETFWLKLENPVNATVNPPRPEGWQGVIIDDDPVPTVSVADCTRVEGNSGSGPCAFVVSLSNPSTQAMSVSYATVGQTAGEGMDFQAATGTLSFLPETTNRTVEVAITGDVEPEWNESFLIHLSSPTTDIADGDGIGTIIDDEAARFHAVTPCRVLDTRGPDGPSGGPVLWAGVPRSFPIAGLCGVPGTAKAVVANVTTTAQSTAGSLRLYPAGLPAPDTSVLNFRANTPRANNATVLLGTSGWATVLADMTVGAQTHVIVDVFGYYQTVVDVDPGRVSFPRD